MDERLKGYARELRQAATPSEEWLWNVVRGRRLGGFKFRRQHVVGPYIADFACVEALVIVELDGAGHEDQVEYDLRRKTFLEEKGFEVLRIGSEHEFSDAAEIPTFILERCRARAGMGDGKG